jgi:hypothetical protein
VYHDVAQWTMVRRKVLKEGVSRRQLARQTGLSRKTIRKMLLHELPQLTSRERLNTRPCGSTQRRSMPLRLRAYTLGRSGGE